MSRGLHLGLCRAGLGLSRFALLLGLLLSLGSPLGLCLLLMGGAGLGLGRFALLIRLHLGLLLSLCSMLGLLLFAGGAGLDLSRFALLIRLRWSLLALSLRHNLRLLRRLYLLRLLHVA